MPSCLKRFWIIYLVFIFLANLNHPSLAQDVSKMAIEDLDSLSLDQLLDIDLLQVASKKPMGRKEIPGTVTIIKRDEIRNAGARDMIDVLNLVPGFAFAVDVQGVTSLGNRGNWADEGKVLVMIDGMPMNELLYATIPFGNRFPVDLIERVEIIRGPGSSFYGGFAELAVINIITASPSDLDGFRISGTYGQMGDVFGRSNLSIAFGKQFDDFGFSASMFLGKANRSNATYYGIDSSSFQMAGNNVLKPLNFNFSANYGNLRGRLIIERYNTEQEDGYDVAIPFTVETDFPTVTGDLAYDIKLTNKLTLTPRVSYIWQQPYESTTIIPGDTSLSQSLFSDKTVQRTTGSITLSGDVTPFLYLTLGTEAYFDHATASAATPDIIGTSNLFSDSLSSISFNDVGIFLQSLWTSNIVNVNAGIRFDKHSAVPAAFVPWIGITKIIDKFNFKLLYGQNFKAPTIMNITLNNAIKPERTTALELELGYQLQYNMMISANIFNVTINDPIVYGVVDNNEEYYNYSHTGTRGVEFDYTLKNPWGYINADYSFYVANDNQVDQYTIPGNSNALLGFAQHKGILNASIALFDGRMSVNPSAVVFGKRYGFIDIENDSILILKKFQPVVLLNLFAIVKNVFDHGIDIGFGVYNIFNARYDFIQPYYTNLSVHPPLPGPSREFLIRLSYDFKWK